MMRVAGLLALIAGRSLATAVPEVSPIEETPAPRPRCPDNCATFFDGCNVCDCDEEGSPISCSRKFCTDKKQPKCIAFNEDKEDTSPPRQCPRGCTTWYDGCNDCSCDAPGQLGACTKRACVTKAEEKCLKWEPKSDDLCPADCSSFFDGCNTCKCVNGKTVGCTRKYCPTKQEPTCLDADLPIGEPKDDHQCPADCSSFYDGCNTCKCVNGKKVGCTKKYCPTKEEATCLDADLPIGGGSDEGVCPADCSSCFDGCNTCKCENGMTTGCTRKFCLRKQEPKCLDVEIPKPEPKQCPEGCTNWFDGCNKCYCGQDGKEPMCTKKMCLQYEEPKCMDSEPKDVSEILRMTFAELKKFCWVNRENSAECGKVCGKAKKGKCKGYKKAGKVKCKKIKDMGFCALIGCDASAGNRCRGNPNFAA